MAVSEYISKKQIQEKIIALGKKISTDYEGQELVVVGVLNGSFMFCADLIREIKVPVDLEFISASSYGDGTDSSGSVEIKLDIKRSIENKNVLLVEDIVDTGLTISSLIKMFEKRNPKSLKVASLLYKPARTTHEVNIDYLAFEIEDKFVIGYGLDFAGKYRELPYIGVYSDDH